jgi:hypothetical protein
MATLLLLFVSLRFHYSKFFNAIIREVINTIYRVT